MGKRAPFIAAAALVFILLAGAVAIYLYDQGRDDLIAKGVTVAGIDVGGMRRAEATRLLQQRLASRLERPVTVKAAGHHFRLTTARSGVTTDVAGMADLCSFAELQHATVDLAPVQTLEYGRDLVLPPLTVAPAGSPPS